MLLIGLSLLVNACSPSIPTEPSTSPSPPLIETNSTQTATPEGAASESVGTATNPVDSITSTPTPPPIPRYFTEEWNGDTAHWFWFTTLNNDNFVDIYPEVGVLEISLTGKNVSSYFIYQPWGYDQVKVTTQIENRTLTKSTTVIVCDYTDDLGWYEFDIDSDGVWQIRLHDTLGKTGYLSLQNGGSRAIHTGEAINEYSISCIGNQLSLIVNGTLVVEYTDKILKFKQGKIGIGAISYTEIPILIESDWLTVEKP